MGKQAKSSISDTIEQKIEKAQAKVIKTKAAYDIAVKDLQILLDKRDAQRKDTLWKAILQSEKTYDEILSYIKSGDGAAED